MNQSHNISIVMSVYNGQRYLREAIESILQQTYIDFEFIIINDGSADDSLKIIQSYNDTRIVLINNDGNKGLIYSLNKGIEVAQGEYIARMDADDISLPTRLEKQFQFLNSNIDIGICGCDYIHFNNKKETTHHTLTNHNEIWAWMLFNSSIVHPSLMIRTSVLKKIDIVFNEAYKHAEDYELWSRLLFTTKFSAVNETLFKYRLHDSQVTVKHNQQQIDSANKVRRNLLIQSHFTFSEMDLKVHCMLGSSQRIQLLEDLVCSEKWLLSLKHQNSENKLVEPHLFNPIIAKQWEDACGNTTLGIQAYRYYFKSTLSQLKTVNRFKLLAKCLIRWAIL